MNRFFIAFAFLFFTKISFAQEITKIKPLLESGNNVYVEVIDLKNDIEGEYEYFIEHLNNKEEWGRWEIAESKDAANFICKVTLEKKGSAMTGIRVFASVEILNPSGKSVWKSKKPVKGNATAYTGFNAHGDAMRKVIRRTLTEDLYLENGITK